MMISWKCCLYLWWWVDDSTDGDCHYIEYAVSLLNESYAAADYWTVAYANKCNQRAQTYIMQMRQQLFYFGGDGC